MPSKQFVKRVTGKEKQMDIIGFIFGLAGLSFALIANSRLNKLEEKLKELEVLEKDFSSKQK